MANAAAIRNSMRRVSEMAHVAGMVQAAQPWGRQGRRDEVEAAHC